jgi:hypothetical protein
MRGPKLEPKRKGSWLSSRVLYVCSTVQCYSSIACCLYLHRTSGPGRSVPTHKSKANNIAGLLAVRFFAAFSQPTHTVVSSLQLIHGPLVSLTDFLGSCAQAGYKLTARFSSLSSPLSSTSAFSRLTACYYTCSNGALDWMSGWLAGSVDHIH